MRGAAHDTDAPGGADCGASREGALPVSDRDTSNGESSYPCRFAPPWFTIPTTVPHGRHPVRFSHRGGSVSAGSYTVGPPVATVQLRPLQLSQTRGGMSVAVTLGQVAVTDLEVRLRGSSPLAVPRSVRFKAGEQRKVFTVGLRPRTRPGTGTVTASVGTGGRGQVQRIQVTTRR